MRSRRLQAGHLAALALAGTLTLAGCTGDDGGSADDAPTGGDGTVATGGTDEVQNTAGGPVAPPTEPADIQAAPGERSASGDGTIEVEADQAGFVLPSGNIACSVTAEGAVCQIEDKDFTPSADHLSEANLEGCTADEADAMRLTDGRGAWTCPPEPVTGQAQLSTGGWWVEQVEGETLDLGGATLAVLPYGSTLTLGPVSCTAEEAGVSCTSSDLGRSFTLAATTYSYG